MKSIQLPPKAHTLIHRIAGILGGFLAGGVVFLFALYTCIHMGLPLLWFLLISAAGFVSGIILAFVFPTLASWSFIFLLHYGWNHLVMTTDGVGDEKNTVPPPPPVLLPAVFFIGILCLVMAFFVPNSWLFLAAGVFVALYPLGVIISVRRASRRCETT